MSKILTEQSIAFALSQKMYANDSIIIPNVSYSYLSWEADVIKITKAGYMTEYEIKITHSDFKADFKKPKHRQLKQDYIIRKPNYFTYVAPIKAIPLCIPDYAGLIEVVQNRWGKIFLDVIKPAKKLHENKISDKDKIKMLKPLMFKYWNVIDKKRR